MWFGCAMPYLNTKMRVTIISLSLVLLLFSCAEETELERTKRQANEGDAMAQLRLGEMYNFGEGIPHDYKEAAKWYRKSAEQGQSKAQCNLGFMYENGRGVPQDYKEAVVWYRMSADQGDAWAQDYLGAMYGKGEGVPKDYKEAIKWIRMSADQGYAMAQFVLGMMYYNGLGVPKDYKQAYIWFYNAKNYHESATGMLDIITEEMTKEQIGWILGSCVRGRTGGSLINLTLHD